MQEDATPVTSEGVQPLRVRIGFAEVDPHVVIYSTIILMASFALFDEGTEQLTKVALLEFMGVAVAPLFALSMAHTFSDALDLQIREGRRLSRRDRWHLLTTNLQYMYVAIPPSLLLVVFWLLDWDANDAVSVVMLLGIASLFFWGAYAGRKAGLGWYRQLTFGVSYGLMGLIVIIVELAITH